MDAILNHPANADVIRSLCRKKGGAVPIVGRGKVRNPYLYCGSHPEIVERVWDQLGRGLASGCRRILCGTPVLVHPKSGVVLAVCYGTSYCLRLPEGALPAALQAGCTIFHRWGNGTVTDLSEEFGPDWVFGCWSRDEEAWCQAAAAACGPPT